MLTYIHSINQVDGFVVEGFEEVGSYMTTFYKNLLGKKSSTRRKIDPEIIKEGHVLSIEQQLHMIRDFTNKNIKEALFSIEDNKSPRPDGFNSGFYKTSWNYSGPLITTAIKHFFRSGRMPRHFSDTKLILIPKVASP